MEAHYAADGSPVSEVVLFCLRQGVTCLDSEASMCERSRSSRGRRAKGVVVFLRDHIMIQVALGNLAGPSLDQCKARA